MRCRASPELGTGEARLRVRFSALSDCLANDAERPPPSPAEPGVGHRRAKHGRIDGRGFDRDFSAGATIDSLLKTTRGGAIAIVASRERKRRQPRLATDGPEFVGWPQLVRGVQGSYVHFDFVCAASENGRAAAGTEKPAGVVACFAIDRHRILREYRGSVKKSSMVLAAVETVTNADPVWASGRHNSDVAAQATSCKSVHAGGSSKSN